MIRDLYCSDFIFDFVSIGIQKKERKNYRVFSLIGLYNYKLDVKNNHKTMNY